MTPRTTILEDQLQLSATGSASTSVWGIALFSLIEAIVVISLLTSYAYYGVLLPEWPPSEVSPPELLLPTLGALSLAAGAAAIVFGDVSLRKKRTGRFRLGLALGALFILGYGVTSTIGLIRRDYLWSSHAYGSLTWTTSGYQLLHVVTAAGFCLFVLLVTVGRLEGRRPRLLARVLSVYAVFVALAGLASYVVIEVSPHLTP